MSSPQDSVIGIDRDLRESGRIRSRFRPGYLKYDPRCSFFESFSSNGKPAYQDLNDTIIGQVSMVVDR